MNAGNISLAAEAPTSPDARELIRQLSADLAVRYDFADDGSGLFSAADVQAPRAAFLVSRLDGRPVGCGALKPMGESGYEHISPYPPYLESARSVCFARQLLRQPAEPPA
ncbi:MAG: hypothetical protein IT306_20870 [Chloroflexi bacterium]|nr:hypothetical protein [Chloroflexota bacterium]